METNDYIRLLLNGYFKNKEFLENEIYREFLEAKKLHIEETEFFYRCYDVIKQFEVHIDNKWNEVKRDLYFALNSAKNGEVMYDYDELNLSEEEKCNLSIKKIENELESYSRYNFSVHLNAVTKGEFSYSLFYSEVLFIKDAIDKAMLKLTIEQTLKNEQSKEKELKIKTLNLNEYNKPVFTQKQISILFKIFKEKNIISNTYLTDTDFSKIICSLTGYSDETIRQNLSKEFKVISDKKTDYEIIISKLTEVINELKRQIK